MNCSVGIVIPTFQGVKQLPFCLSPLLNSPLKPRVLVIDSSSTDGTADLARAMGVEVIVISKREFNHGLTREMGRNHLGTDIVVMITQDAYPLSEDMLEKLVEPIMKGKAAVSYARQLPHVNAGLLSSFSREFNYPASSHIRDLKAIDHYGSYIFFCSNSCAAYLNTALDEIGGFSSVCFGEDTLAVAKLLHHGYCVAYEASAQVRHSHEYSLLEEFRRHYQMGMARHTFQKWICIAGSDHQRGRNFVSVLLKKLKNERPRLIPYALAQIMAKFLGYQAGKISAKRRGLSL